MTKENDQCYILRMREDTDEGWYLSDQVLAEFFEIINYMVPTFLPCYDCRFCWSDPVLEEPRINFRRNTILASQSNCPLFSRIFEPCFHVMKRVVNLAMASAGATNLLLQEPPIGLCTNFCKDLTGIFNSISVTLFRVHEDARTLLPCYEKLQSNWLTSAGATNWLLQEPPIGFCRSHQLVSAGATNLMAVTLFRVRNLFLFWSEES